MEEFRFESCEELMKAIFEWKYPPEEGKPYCRQDPINGKTLPERVWEVVQSLPQKRRERLISRFGLRDGRTKTLEEVGREFGVTGESIRRSEIRAFKQLRHLSRSNKLEPYLENKLAQERVKERLKKEEVERKKREEIERQRRQKEEEERKLQERFSQPKPLSFEEKQGEIKALLKIFEKTQIASTAYRPNRFINKIIRRRFLFFHLKTFDIEELVTILGMPISETEQCLREMWQIVNQKS